MSGATAHGGPITTLAPGALSLVGSAVPADERQCWAPEQPGRWLPLQTYVLQREQSSVIIDTSSTAIREALFEGFSELLADSTSTDVVMTRYNFDTLMNFPWLRSTFAIDRLYTSLLAGVALGTDAVMSFMDAFEDAHTDAHVRLISDVEPLALPQNQDFVLSGRRMRCVAAPVRLLLTNWVYDYETQTLFSSDSWGFATLDSPDERPVIDGSQRHRLTRELLAESMRKRFDWLIGAHTDPLRAALDTFFDEYPVARLCPSHGAVIEGAENVAHVRALTDDVLREFRTASVPRMVVGSPEYPTRVITAAVLKETA